jgi:cytochrome P450
MSRPPGPRSYSPFGYTAFRRDPLATLESLQKQYGDVVEFRLLHRRGYLISNPQLIQEVLVTHNGNFVKSPALKRAKMLLGEGLLTSEEPLHLRQRRLAQSAFHRERLRGYSEIMVRLTGEWIERWDREWPSLIAAGQPVDLHAEAMQLTLSIVSKALYNADMRRDARYISQIGTAVANMFRLTMLPFAEQIVKLPLRASREFRAARDQLDQLMYGLIAERRASQEDKGDLLSMLLMAQDSEGDGGQMSDKQVRDEILTLFLAGHETTANALSWTWYLLALNPDAERRLFEEVDAVLGGREPSMDDVEALRYTYAVFAESMRLYPPAWTMGRTPKQPFDLGGYRIPANSICLMSQWLIHRDPRFWPDPLQFLPDRWLTPDPQRPKLAYFPFGAGPRLCVGERFAWMEGVLILARVAQRWRFRLAPSARIVPQPLITLRLRCGLPVMPERR